MKIISNIRPGLSLLKAKYLKKNFPLFVFFTITNRCNASCRYCFGKYYERYRLEKYKELTTEQIFSIIDELSILRTQRIGIGGGEPLLKEDIGKIITYVRTKGINCGLNTNGYLIPQKIDEVSKANNITVSLDGDMDAHEANRGNGSFKKVMEAIRVIKKYRIPLHVSTVITKNNLNSIGYVMKLAKKIGFLVQVSPLYGPVWGDRGNDFPEQLNREELINTINQILSYKKRGYPVFYSFRTYKNIINWPDFTKDRVMNQEPNFSHTRCYMGKYICTLDANGDVYPCAQLDGFKVKNCLDVGFEKAFDNISQHTCKACFWACYNEYNLLMALCPEAILNTLKNILFIMRYR